MVVNLNYKKIKFFISYCLLDFIFNEIGLFIVLEGILGVKYFLIMNFFFFLNIGLYEKCFILVGFFFYIICYKLMV